MESPLHITPFSIHIEAKILSDLRERIRKTRWPDQAPSAAWEQGTDLEYLRQLLTYWADEFDWLAQERELNATTQFRAELDGVHIHFVHERARHGHGIPLILTHGWPSTFAELLPLVPFLTDPHAHGIDGPGFDVVIPSLPGYGFSERPRRTGVNYQYVAGLWHRLMRGLGYERYGAQGGDFGAGIATFMALNNPEPMIGVHLSNLEIAPYTGPGARPLSAAERTYRERNEAFWQEEYGYKAIQSTKPQTLGYALNDSPAGLAAWILEKWRATNSSSLDFMKPNRHPNINHLAQRITRRRSSQSRQLTFLFALTLLVTTITAGAQQKKSSFADLTKLFAEWRAFQRPASI